jgi:hypothetical protein
MPKPRYSVGMIPGHGYFRQNDGSLSIMEYAETEDTRVVLYVPRVGAVKRSEKYSAPDPMQEAFAEHVVALLNANTLKVF